MKLFYSAPETVFKELFVNVIRKKHKAVKHPHDTVTRLE